MSQHNEIVINLSCMICHESLAMTYQRAIIVLSRVESIGFWRNRQPTGGISAFYNKLSKRLIGGTRIMKKLLTKKKNKKGFTLIELVVVIAILGILAAILVPVIGGFIRTANESADNASGRLVYQAAAMWYASNNTASPGYVDAANPGSGLTITDLQLYLGGDAMPAAKSSTFGAPGNIWVVTVNPEGVISVTLNDNVYVATAGKFS